MNCRLRLYQLENDHVRGQGDRIATNNFHRIVSRQSRVATSLQLALYLPQLPHAVV